MVRTEKGPIFTDESAESDVERTISEEETIRITRGYEASTEEEKTLDKSLNFKLDTIVVLVCAINFVLQGVDKGNIGNAATAKSRAVHSNQSVLH